MPFPIYIVKPPKLEINFFVNIDASPFVLIQSDHKNRIYITF